VLDDADWAVSVAKHPKELLLGALCSNRAANQTNILKLQERHHIDSVLI
jgi:hypothetical protein